MFSTIQDFEYQWSMEIEATQKMLKHLTDSALSQPVAPGYRTLGRLAWHVVTSIRERMERAGLTANGPAPDEPVPASARTILSRYNDTAIGLLDDIRKQWTDASLQEKVDVNGQKWKKGFALTDLISHQIHHRGQMTVLMRQAGLEVPGIYGPSKPEWARWGMHEPGV
jgi:uncharacterized damage-inducible protein DinB